MGKPRQRPCVVGETARRVVQLDVEILASRQSPLINPCFVVRNWPQKVKAQLSIDGRRIPEGKDFRQGIETEWDQWEAKSSLVLWVRFQSEETVNFTIEMEN